MANVRPNGFPQNLYPNDPFGSIKTLALYAKFTDCFSLDAATSKITIKPEVGNTAENWKQILQLFQDVDNWAQLFPADVTPMVTRISNILLKLRKASDTDAPYDAYELILFWNIALRPDYFLPFFFAESVYNTYIILAKDYTYEMLFTRVQNDRQRAINPNAPIVTPKQAYPNYTPPPSSGGNPSPSDPNTPVTPKPDEKKTSVWTWVALVFVLVLIILIAR